MTNQPAAATPAPSFETFRTAVGETFTISFTDARFDLVLREAKALQHHASHLHPRAPFSLLFVCPDPRIIEQGTFAIEHERMGMLGIFLVPVGADAEGVHYQAVFN